MSRHIQQVFFNVLLAQVALLSSYIELAVTSVEVHRFSYCECEM